MWLFTNSAFISIVADRDDPTKLLVRARLPHDINSVFPTAKLFSARHYDYKYRALIDRREVAKVIAEQLLNVDYDNFKNSVRNKVRHAAYLGVWSVMHGIQH